MNDALVVTNFSLVIVTAGLVLVTWLYVRHTKRMADIMAKGFEYRVSPLIKVIQIGRLGLSFKPIRIENIGFYPVFLEEVELDWWYTENKEKIYSKREKINQWLTNNEEKDLSLGLDEHDLQKDEYPESKNLNGSQLVNKTSGILYLSCKDVEGRQQRIELKTLQNSMA